MGVLKLYGLKITFWKMKVFTVGTYRLSINDITFLIPYWTPYPPLPPKAGIYPSLSQSPPIPSPPTEPLRYFLNPYFCTFQSTKELLFFWFPRKRYLFLANCLCLRFVKYCNCQNKILLLCTIYNLQKKLFFKWRHFSQASLPPTHQSNCKVIFSKPYTPL